MLFVDKENKVIYISKDELNHHETAALPTSSDHIVMHPNNSDWLLLYDYNERKVGNNFILKIQIIELFLY